MDKWRGKVAIVTGANSGIGAEIATALVREGVVVVGLDLREDNIKSLAKEFSKQGVSGKLYSVKTDVRKEEDVIAAFRWIEKELGGADVLVNNAGVGSLSYVADSKTEEWRDMLEVNVLGLAICSREFINSLDKRNSNTGQIINISSISGHEPLPRLAMYSATKHALKAFSMSLRKELTEKNSNIKVTIVSPGPVKTPIYDGTELEDVDKKMAILLPEDVSKVVVDILSASNVTLICDVIMNPFPTKSLT